MLNLDERNAHRQGARDYNRGRAWHADPYGWSPLLLNLSKAWKAGWGEASARHERQIAARGHA